MCTDVEAQPAGANYDESKVPQYVLPDPLTSSDGTRVDSPERWQKRRRPEILKLFETHVYGRTPEPVRRRFKQTSEDKNALGGKATRKEVTVLLIGTDDGPTMDLLLYIPNNAKRPVPAFLGLNFAGNHSVHSDPGIALARCWLRDTKDGSVTNNRATNLGRGKEASRWQIDKLIDRGYALVTACYCDIEPDHADGYKDSLRSIVCPRKSENFVKSAIPPRGAPADAAPDDWGAIGAWAYGLSRAMDYLEKENDIDEKRVAVIGHSRLGKTSLWAGAQDERFAIVISNDSGEGGAALSKRRFGETVERINTSFPHWFCGNFKQYNDNEAQLPLDQHMLIALIAPRPVYVASAEEDLWADPKGEFLAAKRAEPVYRLFALQGLGVSEMPALNQPVGKTIGYHIRSGKHDVTEYDWEQYLDFADRHFKR
ncbi:MAG: acetylxylan esterase [Verrucomicrobia subdivision 3 bacterium]|nr:acetylxylan esterase [Limisphaerales bacterium]